MITANATTPVGTPTTIPIKWEDGADEALRTDGLSNFFVVGIVVGLDMTVVDGVGCCVGEGLMLTFLTATFAHFSDRTKLHRMFAATPGT